MSYGKAVGCQQSDWMAAGTEQQDETGRGGRRADPITVETIGNHVHI